MELPRFERTAIERLVAGDKDEQILLRQLATAEVSDREYSGVGMFVSLRIGDMAAPLQTMPNRVIEGLEDWGLTHPQLEHGGGIILFVAGGFMKTLECFTNVGDWPKDEDLLDIVPVRINRL